MSGSNQSQVQTNSNALENEHADIGTDATSKGAKRGQKAAKAGNAILPTPSSSKLNRNVSQSGVSQSIKSGSNKTGSNSDNWRDQMHAKTGTSFSNNSFSMNSQNSKTQDSKLNKSPAKNWNLNHQGDGSDENYDGAWTASPLDAWPESSMQNGMHCGMNDWNGGNTNFGMVHGMNGRNGNSNNGMNGGQNHGGKGSFKGAGKGQNWNQPNQTCGWNQNGVQNQNSNDWSQNGCIQNGNGMQNGPHANGMQNGQVWRNGVPPPPTHPCPQHIKAQNANLNLNAPVNVVDAVNAANVNKALSPQIAPTVGLAQPPPPPPLPSCPPPVGGLARGNSLNGNGFVPPPPPGPPPSSGNNNGAQTKSSGFNTVRKF